MKILSKKYYLLFLGLGLHLNARPQVSNDSLEYRIRPDESRNGRLYLSVENFNFLRNYEFYNKIQDGYTLFGTQLAPQLAYYPNGNLVVAGGVYLRKDFGTSGVDKVQPLFSIKYHKKSFTLITGALESTIHHRFIEPLFDVEKRITDPVEYGTQVVMNNRSVFFDGFIRWKRMIYKPSPEQEQIVAGASSEFALAQSQKLKFSIPLQLTVFHQGGQIDTINQPLQTLMNLAAGIRFSGKPAGFITAWNAEGFFVGYDEFSPTKQQPFSGGSGMYLNARMEAKAGSLSAGYWDASKFISPTGMPVFQSLSQQINYPGYTERQRKLLFLRYAYQKQLVPHFWLDFRVEPVFDLGLNKRMDFYHSLFLVYRQEFRLVK